MFGTSHLHILMCTHTRPIWKMIAFTRDIFVFEKCTARKANKLGKENKNRTRYSKKKNNQAQNTKKKI